MTKSKEIKLEITDHIPNGTFNIDVDVVYRIVENIINNALRYAKKKIKISFEIKNNFLIIIVKDDGIGFSENVLSGNHKLIISNNKDGHYGMGLTISRILCNKHGGELKLDNDEKNGAKVIIKIQIWRIFDFYFISYPCKPKMARQGVFFMRKRKIYSNKKLIYIIIVFFFIIFSVLILFCV